MNTDTKYKKLEIVVTGVGDFITTFTERTAIQNAGTERAMGTERRCWGKYSGIVVMKAGD